MNHLHEIVKVIAVFNPDIKGKIDGMLPLKFKWKNRDYNITEITLHHTQMIEGVINHIFCVIAGGSIAELHFNTKTLIWTIEQIQDSETSA